IPPTITMTKTQPDPELAKHRFYFFSFVIIRIMRYTPTGHASSAATFKKPLARAPKDIPKSAIAPTSRRGAAQHMVIGSTPLSQPFPCILQAVESLSDSTSALDALP